MQDAAACLLRDGQVVAAVEEERLVRRKHTGAFPEHAIRWCLRDAGIAAGDLDHVAFNMRPLDGLEARLGQLVAGLPRSLATFGSRGPSFLAMLAADRWFGDRIGRGRARFHFVDHHRAHAASALYPSGFEEAAVLVADGSGELASTTGYLGCGTDLRPVMSLPFPHSLGYFYSALTQWLGFQPAVDEGKIMGLASYGTPEPGLMSSFRAMISDGGAIDPTWFRYQFNGPHYFSRRWREAFGPPREPEAPIAPLHQAVAAAGQRRLEEVLVGICRRLHRRTGQRRLCLAGGVALNCVANARLLEETPFEALFVQPAAHDAGTAYGAALAVTGRRVPRQTRADFGPQYDAAAVDQALREAGLQARQVPDPGDAAAGLIAEGRVVGWFQGRMELGPRALGHRSILADPRDADMPDRVNERIKRRERFRPFAPAVLASRAAEWFDGDPTPFMTVVCRVRRADVPAITHVDGTARVQTVCEGPLLPVLQAMERRTGIPMVLNTSFNLRGEPIVCSPAEAIRDYLRTDLDALVLGDRVLVK